MENMTLDSEIFYNPKPAKTLREYIENSFENDDHFILIHSGSPGFIDVTLSSKWCFCGCDDCSAYLSVEDFEDFLINYDGDNYDDDFIRITHINFKCDICIGLMKKVYDKYGELNFYIGEFLVDGKYVDVSYKTDINLLNDIVNYSNDVYNKRFVDI